MQEQMTLMLQQMRFANGDTLADRLEDMRMKKKIKKEEERLKKEQDKSSSSSSSDGEDDFGESSSGEETSQMQEESDEDMTESITSSNSDSFMGDSASAKSDDDQDELNKEKADPNYLNNIVHAKKGLKENREAFLASINDDVGSEEKDRLIKQFDE